MVLLRLLVLPACHCVMAMVLLLLLLQLLLLLLWWPMVVTKMVMWQGCCDDGGGASESADAGAAYVVLYTGAGADAAVLLVMCSGCQDGVCWWCYGGVQQCLHCASAAVSR